MTRPPFGLVVPCVLESIRDADSVVVRIPGSAINWALRLCDVWAPELRSRNQLEREIAHKGKRWLQEKLEDTDPAILAVQIPLPKGANILASLTFDRVPAYLWAGDELINETIVRLGYASSKKGGPLGE